ncbi:uncharacterized protein MELLADRAFT_68692 [Melampsora larici-populina 98AG31]|uniref:ATP11-domain-containing protein n=1 Tax=Melampsora larici-populina (strain 98AG31 / pathotype 3-4-7) TaxID=747676 RepID=F4S7U3_MELLP|nr:uncharacterized protein MELLADRAFT_68692 [Melampsora larici-populina 98AG31]EGF99270.1 hypothetical protein MELLADRAFT_68692 [Melampsora larici-populina 98AG31]
MLNRLINPLKTYHHQTKLKSITTRTFIQHHPTNQQHSLNSNQIIQEKKISFESKYQSKLQSKLKQTGLKDLDELKKVSNQKLKLEESNQIKLQDELLKKFKKSNLTLNQNQHDLKVNQTKLKFKEKKYRSPIKPLDDILDLSKVINQSSDTIKQLWTAYHLKPSSPPRLGAVIPLEIYQTMLKVAQKYSSFVIPIPTSSTDEIKPDQTPLQMHFLQWSFLQPEAHLHLTEDFQTIKTPVSKISPTTVLFTPLIEYQLKQEFAQPGLILTHYTELAESHGIVLMRGDLTPSLNDPTSSGRIGTTEAQLLILRLQQFYYWSRMNESLMNDSQNRLQKVRQDLLRCFHEKPNEFDIEELIKSIKDI